MKKVLSVCLAIFIIAVSYKVYASTIENEINADAGCENDPRIECRVWIVLPEGGTTKKEPGINKMSIDEPEEVE